MPTSNTIRTGTFLALFTLAAAQAGAQASHAGQAAPTSVAVLSIEQVVMGTAEYAQMLATLNAKYKPLEDNLALEENKIQQLDKEIITLSGDAYVAKLKELNAAERQFDHDHTAAQNGYNSDAQQRMQVIDERVDITVRAFAIQHGYNIILDLGTPLYLQDAVNITSSVLAAYLAIENPQKAPPSDPPHHAPHVFPVPAPFPHIQANNR